MRFGMDFGGTGIKAALIEEDGAIFRETVVPTTRVTESPDPMEALCSIAVEMVGSQPLTMAGLAIKGLVDSARGCVVDDIGAGKYLSGRPLGTYFSQQLDCPVAVDNDARSYAWGEWKFGAGRGAKVLLCLTLGTGIGCSVVKDGRPYEGATPVGGILGGHISIDRNGPQCMCGQKGCFELYCSASALAERVRKAHPELRDTPDVLPAFFDLLRRGAGSYEKTLHAYQDDLTVGVVNVIHAYGPDVVVVGGGVMRSADVVFPRFAELVRAGAWTVPRGAIDLRPSALGNRAAVLGAAFHPLHEDVAPHSIQS